MILHQHEAVEFQPEMTFDPPWQWCQDRPPVGRHPAFVRVTGRTHRNQEVLHQKGFVSLEARAWRDLRLDYRLFNADPRRYFAPATTRLVFRRFYISY